MTKIELIDAIAGGVNGPAKTKVEQILDVTLQAIMGFVDKGNTVSLIGFGTFSQGERTGCMARNPYTGEEIKVEAAKTIKFRADQEFKDTINA